MTRGVFAKSTLCSVLATPSGVFTCGDARTGQSLVVTAIAGRKPLPGRAPELVLLPREDGTLVLTWLPHVRVPGDIVSLFLDAQTGQEVQRITDLRRQASVGTQPVAGGL